MALAGQVTTGGVVSVTVIICVQVELFPEASVAVHVLVMVSVRTPHPGTELSLNVIVGLGSVSSVAVAAPVFAGEVSSPHSIPTSAGQVITGGVVSCAFIVHVKHVINNAIKVIVVFLIIKI
jgi:hypothetical protein